MTEPEKVDEVAAERLRALAPAMLSELKRLHEKTGYLVTADLIAEAEGRTLCLGGPSADEQETVTK